MNIELSALDARIIGCLIEKEITTPDQYPLSLNALTNACNQKTNRDPVLELTENEVQDDKRANRARPIKGFATRFMKAPLERNGGVGSGVILSQRGWGVHPG